MARPAGTTADNFAGAADPDTSPRHPRRRRRIIGALALASLVALAATVFSVGFGRDPSVVRSVLLNRAAPALTGTTLDGGPLDLRDYRGKTVLVNVWASWCAACRTEHPVLAAAQREYPDRGLQIVGVDMSDTVVDAQKFLAEMGGAAYPSVQDPNAQIAIAWGTFGVPETYVVDRTGVIREKAVGAVTPDWLDAHVVPLLAHR
jgi:cytochrome c biogenesis protein CcmG/thiol:disulfide interchange protein DsbE